MKPPTRRRLAAPLVLALSVVGGPASAGQVEFEGGFPVTRKAQIYPLSEVKVGDKGTGYTVFTGAKAEPFGVEVLGVLNGMLGPGKHVILARLTGEKIEFSGVISGMSGSPVYIDGRLVGAVSYRFGSFAKEPIAGITPIQSMLDLYGDDVGPAPSTARAVSATPLRISDLRRRDPVPLTIPHAPRMTGPHDPRPIETPIMLSGFPPVVAEELKGQLAAAGMMAVVGGGAGGTASRPSPRSSGKLDVNTSARAGGAEAAPIAPGSPVAVILMRGDLFISGTGTVTYVEDGVMLGFGHPMFGYGHVAFPMATASILNTLASQIGSYKQASPALEVGSIKHDRLTAIGGNFKQIAPMVPARIRVQRADEPKNAPGVEMNVEIVDHDTWVPLMLGAAIRAATDGRLGLEAGGTLDVKASLTVGDRTLTIEDTYVAFAPTSVGQILARDLGAVTRIIKRTGLARANIKSFDVQVRARAEPELAWLESVVPERRLVRGGETLRLIATLRPYRGKRVDVPIDVAIPRNVEGDLEVFVGGAIDVDRRDATVYGDRYPRDMDALLGILSERRPGRGLYARSYVAHKGLRKGAELMPSLPASQRLSLGGGVGSIDETVNEAFGPATRVPYRNIVAGGVKIVVRVSG